MGEWESELKEWDKIIYIIRKSILLRFRYCLWWWYHWWTDQYLPAPYALLWRLRSYRCRLSTAFFCEFYLHVDGSITKWVIKRCTWPHLITPFCKFLLIFYANTIVIFYNIIMIMMIIIIALISCYYDYCLHYCYY